jgi:PAS domain S-box-containing protein
MLRKKPPTDSLEGRELAERRLAAEHAVTRILADSQTLAQAVPRILKSLSECLDCVFSAFWHAERGAVQIRCTETWQASGVSLEEFAALCRSMTFERGIGLPGRVWQNGTPAWISELSADPNFPRFKMAARVGLKSGFAFPIQVKDKSLGIMEFFMHHRAAPDQRLLDMMGAIGSEIGQFIERKEAEEALAASEAITRSIINSALDAVITMDANGKVSGWNKRAEQMFGWKAEEAIGKRLDETVIPERFRERHRAGLQRYLETGRSNILDQRIEIEGLRRDGSEFPVELTVTAIQIGGAHFFSAFLRDITEQQSAKKRLREESQAKDDFLAMLAHELRNPLNPILSAVHIMSLAGPDEPVMARARGIIDRQVRHMVRLIDDLLDLSRISRGKILLRRERVDLVPIVEAVVEDHRNEIESCGHTVTLELPAEPLWVSGDPTRLAQIVGNILQNANKFTNSGGTIRVGASPTPGKEQAVVSIRDTGIGMEPRMLERVFESFTQADRSLNHSGGGLGLGLALVKGLVDLHGGSVHASSEGLGKGSEFSISLPLSMAPDAKPETEKREAPGGSPCRVLLIEDHADSGAGAALFLRLSGHVVELALTGTEGIERARQFRPDVVLCDIGLEGGMDGYDVARVLRSDPRFVGSYLVAVTGYGREEDIQRSREAGFNRHLTKPVDPKALEGMLREIAARLPGIRA